MQPLKQVLHQIDESGSGRMSYHDFYVSLYGPFSTSARSMRLGAICQQVRSLTYHCTPGQLD